MTQLGSIVFGPAYKDFDKFFVGFDDQFNRLSRLSEDLSKSSNAFPYYNIIKTDEDKYTIEIACAGFGQQDIEIELKENTLVIKGNVKNEGDQNSLFPTYLFKGIANRSFTRTFALDDHIEIQGAELLNGILKVFLERFIPEHKKPKKIPINSGKTQPQLLNEMFPESSAKI